MSGVVRKSITLLTTIKPSEEKEEWSATEISRRLNLPVQTVHRLLTCLSECGFVYKNKETKKFRLGLALMELGLSIRDNLSVRNAALPVMEKIAGLSKESVYLTVPENNEGVFIDCIDSPQLLKIAEPTGMRLPLSVGASKKVMLAFFNLLERDRIIEELMQNKTEKSLKKLKEEILIINNQGFAISFGETTEGTASVAAPIFSWENKVVASISIAGPETRFQETQLKNNIRLVTRAAVEISEELGWLKRG
ncbi:IclR family transcriptional regulator [Alteribacillus sp. YIM 98480]|uniref:IclR family transcriptional regulator n=1 Tax=Alteribacillus sp. YIM 98480 TaxID=2606599 RepID=UPI00131AB3EC|nr:IclR family transcriptional regulator [Alteribacillus sp. YIM 98480]